ncbi:peptidase M16B family nonpeptidase-like protein [Clostridium sp. CAG:967]|nr:peptidase M16B family nonpeptidase-like protein [Clostridium sp. CAG:967]
MDTKVTCLKNNIEFAYKKNSNTPRVAFYLNFSLNNPLPEPGVYSLMVRLFMQGTKNRTAQQLSEELDKYAIEFSSELKLDYIKFKFVCLNEDFSKALEIFEDIIKNTTFDDFDKERAKLEGEIVAELDSPRAKVIDGYYKNIYEGHNYGYTNTVILENLNNLKKEDVVNAYKTIVNDSKKVAAFVGDLEYDDVFNQLDKAFGDIAPSVKELPDLRKPVLDNEKNIEITKPDMNQAHIIKGWIADTANSDDYPALALLNIILGASGLSSRLFLELRDKKGLAYVVRSSYDIAKLAANFSIYIATEPKNIDVSLKGFDEEIQKIKNVLVSEEELENAKNNIFGKWAFIGETNSQQANWLAHYGINGFGFDFQESAKERIKKVTPQDIMDCANKYFNEKSVTVILKP